MDSQEEKSANSQHAQSVVSNLLEVFGSSLDKDIIESVAWDCNYDAVQSTNCLLELLQEPDENTKSEPDTANQFVQIQQETTIWPSVNSTDRSRRSKSVPKQQKKTKPSNLERVVSIIKQGNRVLVLLRGLPGSGKSHLAKQILDNSLQNANYSEHIFSADNFFIKRGTYKYDVQKLSAAHAWNQRQATEAMFRNINPVIIDNTNTEMWEMKPYAAVASSCGYVIEILEPETHWAFNLKELSKRNTHGVPRTKIDSMKLRYEKNVTPQKLSSAFNIPLVKPRSFNNAKNNNKPDYVIMDGNVERASISSQVQEENQQNPKNWRNYVEIPEFVPSYMSGYNFSSISCNGEQTIKSSEDVSSSSFVSEKTSNKWSPPSPTQNKDAVDSGMLDEASNAPDEKDLLIFSDSSSETEAEANKFTSYLNLEHLKISWSNTQTSNMEINNTEEDTLCPYPVFPQELLKPAIHGLNETPGISRLSFKNNQNEEKEVLKPAVHGLNETLGLSRFSFKNNQNEVQKPAVHGLNETIGLSRFSFKNNQNEEKGCAPSLQKGSDCSSKQEQTNKKGELTFNLAAWGLNESALVSWEAPDTQNAVKQQPPKCELRECETQTESLFLGPDRNSKLITPKTFKPANNAIQSNIFKSKLTLEKSSMTDDIEPGVEEKCIQIQNMFPNLPPVIVEEILAKCNYNTEWAADLLLEDKGMVLDIPMKEDFTETTSEMNVQIDDKGDQQNKTVIDQQRQFLKNYFDQQERNKETEELKQVLENKIKFDDSYYSEHVLKLKRMRGNHSSPIDIPSCSKDSNEIDELSEGSEGSSSDSSELIELNLGDYFVEQLESKLGDSNFAPPKGYQPVIQVPLQFARQLHAYYLESVYSQIDAENEILQSMIKEDEELAKTLQAEEYNQEMMDVAAQGTCLRTIMSDEAKLSRTRKTIEKIRNETPDTLAMRLTRKKLFDNFPTIDKETLVELLFAHGNNYTETVSSILASNPELDAKKCGNLKDPPISPSTVENMKKDEIRAHETNIDLTNEGTARDYRNEASRVLELRQELLQSAHKYMQRKMPEVASFYYNLAREQTKKYDLANSAAVQYFVREQSKVINNSLTIDLHSLTVKEAISVLDVSIDQVIDKAKNSKKPYSQVYIITGRGKHSNKGVSVLKPAVTRHLNRRSITYSLMNAGLLRVTIFKHTRTTQELDL